MGLEITTLPRQLRFHHVNFLAFTAGYARKEAQVHTHMRLVVNCNNGILPMSKALAICVNTARRWRVEIRVRWRCTLLSPVYFTMTD